MPKSPVLQTVGGLLVRDGRTLLGYRAGWKPLWPNYWDAIGGQVEPGETAVAALKREILEETGVAAADFRFLADIDVPDPDNSVGIMSSIFAVLRWTGGEPRNTCDEHTELRWFTPTQIAKLDRVVSHDYPALARQAVTLAQAGM